MLVVGLTGGIASGKSTVSKTLKEKYKLTVVDADIIARQVVEPGTRGYNQIIDTFGDVIPDLVKSDNSLNREALGRHVFGNKDNISKLNAIVHPAVRREISRQILWAYVRLQKLVILDIPLLFESGLHNICGSVITVSCSRDIQVQRLLSRNPELSPDDANKRISSQMSTHEKDHKADIIIRNDKDIHELEKAISAAINKLNINPIITVLDYFPPFALLSAFLTICVRYFRDRSKGLIPKQD